MSQRGGKEAFERFWVSGLGWELQNEHREEKGATGGVQAGEQVWGQLHSQPRRRCNPAVKHVDPSFKPQLHHWLDG